MYIILNIITTMMEQFIFLFKYIILCRHLYISSRLTYDINYDNIIRDDLPSMHDHPHFSLNNNFIQIHIFGIFSILKQAYIL